MAKTWRCSRWRRWTRKAAWCRWRRTKSIRHRRRGQNHRRGQRRSELPRAGHVHSEQAGARHCRQQLALAAGKDSAERHARRRNTRMNLMIQPGTHSNRKTAARGDDRSKRRTPRRFTARMSRDGGRLKDPGGEFISPDRRRGWYFVNDQLSANRTTGRRSRCSTSRNVSRLATTSLPWGSTTSAAGRHDSNVSVDIVGKPEDQPWSRSLFNGLAQIIVQSTRDAGEIKLTATADGLKPATVGRANAT